MNETDPQWPPCESDFARPDLISAGPYEPVEHEPHGALWWYYLFLRPRIFFQHFVIEPVPILTALAAWVLGISGVIDNLSTDALQGEIGGEPSALDLLVTSWGAYWILCLVVGVIGGILYFGVGGWWYRARLGFSGADRPDSGLSRRVYLFASQVYAIPAIFYAIWETNHYESPAAAYRGDDLLALVVVLFLLWSVYTSYRGVRTVFAVRKWAARFWFLILPSATYIFLFGGISAIAIMQSGAWTLEPNVREPVVIQRPSVRVSYPGNWYEETEAEGYDADHNLMLVSMAANAYARVTIYDSAVEPREVIEETMRTLPESATFTSKAPIDRWGRYEGFGYDVTLDWDGEPYRALFFAAAADQQTFQITEVCDSEVNEVLQPGFDLIRRSFRLISD